MCVPEHDMDLTNQMSRVRCVYMILAKPLNQQAQTCERRNQSTLERNGDDSVSSQCFYQILVFVHVHITDDYRQTYASSRHQKQFWHTAYLHLSYPELHSVAAHIVSVLLPVTFCHCHELCQLLPTDQCV